MVTASSTGCAQTDGQQVRRPHLVDELRIEGPASMVLEMLRFDPHEVLTGRRVRRQQNEQPQGDRQRWLPDEVLDHHFLPDRPVRR